MQLLFSFIILAIQIMQMQPIKNVSNIIFYIMLYNK